MAMIASSSVGWLAVAAASLSLSMLPASSSAFLLPARTPSAVVALKNPSSVLTAKLLIRNHHPLAAATTTAAAAEEAESRSSILRDHYSFDQMKAVESRLEDLEREAPDMLSAFYEPHLKSFSVRPGSVKNISVTSTCFALLTIFSNQDLFSDIMDFTMKPMPDLMGGDDQSSTPKKIPLRGVVKALLRGRTREEEMPPNVPLLLYTVLTVDRDRSVLNSDVMDAELCHGVKQLISATLENRPKRRSGMTQPVSNYVIYLITMSLAALVESTPPTLAVQGGGAASGEDDDVGLGGLPNAALPEGAASSAVLALARCVEVSYNGLCRQLAFRSAGDMTSFDVMKLAYSLLTYIRASEAMEGTAGREVAPGEGPASGTVVKPVNRRLVQAALDAFFAEQNPDGTWDQGQPIYQSFRKAGRDVGNAFVFKAETVGSLLDALPAEDFRPHLDKLNRLLGWIEQHQLVEIIPDYCDAETGQCYGKPLRGWASPHMTSRFSNPAGWSTSHALTSVIRMRKTIQKLLHIDVLEEFGGKTNGGVPKLASWDRLLDTDLGDPADGITLKDVLNDRMVFPFSDTIEGGIGSAQHVPKVGIAYSAILFGPPGTAKSTICEALAERIGWDFLVIDTSHFLEDGLTNVATRIRYLFTRLRSLTNCVILFDEIEEFCLDRETPGLGMESRMLTTSMLTQINDLRKAKKSVFFLATNRLRAFDSAIIRPGRFDMQLFVGTPNLESRVIQLRNQLASMPVSQGDKDEAEGAFRSFLSSVWSEDAMFFNYLEGLQFASACANVVAAGSPLTEERMAAILKAQATVMTVRGQVREEYAASMGLSRL